MNVGSEERRVVTRAGWDFWLPLSIGTGVTLLGANKFGVVP